jgi:hypothetical protein
VKTSDDDRKPLELPVSFRMTPAPEAWIIRNLESGHYGAATLDAVFIDRHWGVWLDPNALLVDRNDPGVSPETHVIVNNEGGSFTVATLPGKWKKGKGVDEYLHGGMIPVARIKDA